MAGFLVVLEGIDGSGKSTLASNMVASLSADGHRVVATREPTNGPFGQKIRQIARGGRDHVDPRDELALFHADRQQHVQEVVRPQLARGAVIIQDRSYFSTVAYQSQRGLDPAKILADSRAIAPTPDVLLVVDLPVSEALARIRAGRAQGADDFEQAESLERIRQCFLSFEEATVLDGRLAPAELNCAALRVVQARLLPPTDQ